MSYFPALPIFTWGNKPAASSVNPGTTIRIIDVGLATGIVMTSDGANWVAAGAQVLARSGVASTVTGTTTETTLATLIIPGGLLGVSGGLRVIAVTSQTPQTANNKTLRMKLGATTLWNNVFNNAVGSHSLVSIRNRNSATSQVAGASGTTAGVGAGTSVTGTENTATDLAFAITMQLAVGTDTVSLDQYSVELVP